MPPRKTGNSEPKPAKAPAASALPPHKRSQPKRGTEAGRSTEPQLPVDEQEQPRNRAKRSKEAPPAEVPPKKVARRKPNNGRAKSPSHAHTGKDVADGPGEDSGATKQRMAMEAIAKLNAAEDAELEVQDLVSHLRLSAHVSSVVGQAQLVPSLESEGEEFDLDNVSGSSEDDEPPVTKSKSKGKRTKGGLCAAIQARTAAARKTKQGEDEKDDSAEINNQLSSAALEPKHYHKSGQKKSTRVKDSEAQAVPVVGGLDDEDIDDVRPAFGSAIETAGQDLENATQRSKLSRNELVQVSQPVAIRKPTISQTARKQRSTASLKEQVLRKVPSDITSRKKQLLQNLKVPTMRRSISAEPLAQDSRKEDSAGNMGIFTQPVVHVQELLSERPEWKHSLIPSLTHALFISTEPFTHMRRECREFRQLVGGVWALVFPFTNMDSVGDDEALYMQMAYDRVNTKRSLIAKHVLNLVVEYFARPEFKNNSPLIKKHAIWALSGDGFAWHAHPTPIGFAGKPNELGYTPPEGLFQSTFIVNTAKKFISQVDGSVLSPLIGATNPPYGLYSLILTSLYRAFTLFFDKPEFDITSRTEKKAIPEFSHDKYWYRLARFQEKLAPFSERRWEEILGPLGLRALSDDVEVNASDISAFADNIYIPESPVKASGGLRA